MNGDKDQAVRDFAQDHIEGLLADLPRLEAEAKRPDRMPPELRMRAANAMILVFVGVLMFVVTYVHMRGAEAVGSYLHGAFMLAGVGLALWGLARREGAKKTWRALVKQRQQTARPPSAPSGGSS